MTALAGRTALVTGASRGIGAAVADALVADGATVVRLARSLADGSGQQLHDLRCDLTRPADVDRVRDAVLERFGAPDILVNNAGAFLLRPLADTGPDEFRGQLEANLTGPFLVLRAFLSAMRAAGRGHVVTVGSIADHVAMPGNAGYAASKFGVRGLHEVARAELAGSGVRTTLLSPGPTDTPLWDPVNPDARDDLPDRAGMLRPADVADAIRYVVTRPAGVAIELVRIMPA